MKHRGFTLIEVMASLVLLGTAAMTLAPLLAWAARDRQAAEQRQLAVAEAANVLERVARRPFQELAAGSLESVSISPAARLALDDARLEIAVDDESGQPAAKRIRVVLYWKDRTGRELVPARLTTWTYQRKEPS